MTGPPENRNLLARCTDTSDPGHFGPKTLRTYQSSDPGHFGMTEVSGHFRTGAEVSYGHFRTSAEVSLGHFRTRKSQYLQERPITLHIMQALPVDSSYLKLSQAACCT